MQNVTMLSDESLVIEGEEYDLEAGDVVALSFRTARKYVNQFGIASYNGEKYPVLEEDYEEKVGPVGETAEASPEDNPSNGAKDALENKGEDDDGEEETEDNEGDEDERPAGDVDVTELTVSEVEDEAAEVEDEAVLKGMLKSEEEGEDRKTAKEAITERLDELEASEESEEEDQ